MRGLGGLLAVAALLLGIPSVALAAPTLSLELSPATGGTYVPSRSTSLILKLSNAAGADTATAAALSLNLPSGVTLGGVTCSATAGSSCDSTALPTGASVAAGGTLTVTATLNFAADASGSKTVDATGSASGAASVTASATFARTPATDLGVAAAAVETTSPISDCPTVTNSYTPDCTAEYQVMFVNGGPDGADGAQISLSRSEAAAAAFTWACSASDGATCPAASGSGPFSATAVADFP